MGKDKEALDVVRNYKPLKQLCQEALATLRERYGYCLTVAVVQIFALQTGQLPIGSLKRFFEVENALIKRRNVEKYEVGGANQSEFQGNEEFMKYFNEYKKNGFAAFGFDGAKESRTPASQSRAFHLAALYA